MTLLTVKKSFIFVFQQPGSYEEKKHKTISKKLTRFARETKAAKTLGKYLSMFICYVYFLYNFVIAFLNDEELQMFEPFVIEFNA